MQVSIIIVNWNGRHLMQKCLPSVMESDAIGFNVIIVDNASTDRSVDWLKETYPSVEIVENAENLGYAGGNNAAIRRSFSEFVLLLNSDVEVARGWLEPLVQRIQSDPRIAAVVPKIMQYEDRHAFEYAGAAGGFIDDYGVPFARGRIFRTVERDRGQYEEPADVFWGSGAALLLRRSALDEVGLLDERFFMHMEEIDLCWRLRRAGYRIVYEPGSRVFHIGGASLDGSHPRKVYYNVRNSLLMVYKNGACPQWARRLSVRIALDSAAAIRFIVTGHPRTAAAIARAHRDAHRMSKHYKDSCPLTDEAPLPYRGSIAFDYHVRRKRRFGDLDVSRFRPGYDGG